MFLSDVDIFPLLRAPLFRIEYGHVTPSIKRSPGDYFDQQREMAAGKIIISINVP